MQKDYNDMTDREKLIYVLEDIGADLIYSGVSGGTITLFTTYDSDAEVEFHFSKKGEFASVVAY